MAGKNRLFSEGHVLAEDCECTYERFPSVLRRTLALGQRIISERPFSSVNIPSDYGANYHPLKDSGAVRSTPVKHPKEPPWCAVEGEVSSVTCMRCVGPMQLIQTSRPLLEGNAVCQS